jgi:hypothetical protein
MFSPAAQPHTPVARLCKRFFEFYTNAFALRPAPAGATLVTKAAQIVFLFCFLIQVAEAGYINAIGSAAISVLILEAFIAATSTYMVMIRLRPS